MASAKTLGLAADDTPGMIREVLRGFPFSALTRFEAASGLGLKTLADLVGIPDRTLARRKTANRLTTEESERLLRVWSLFDKTVTLFEGDRAAAMTWLSTPKRALAAHTPLEYSKTEIGARAVEDLIGRLEHGVFS